MNASAHAGPAEVPPVLPPALPVPTTATARRGLGPVGIVAICAAAVFLLLGAAAVAAGLLIPLRAAKARQARAAERAQAERLREAEFRDARSFGPAPVTTPGGGARQAEAGITYTNVRVASVPWSIHVLKIDRAQKDLMIFSAHARDKVLGVSFIADQARAVPREIGRALAGVNGDFYVRDNPSYAGDPRGLQIVNGELISAPDTVCVWFDNDGNPHLDEVKGDFHVQWPDGSKTPFGLNQQRSSSMAVLYTPTYGPSTRVTGGRDLILEKTESGPWLPLQAGQTYRARVHEIATNGNTRLVTNSMVLSLGPGLRGSVPDVTPGMEVQISTLTTPDLKGVKAAIAGGPELIKNGSPFNGTPPPGLSRDYSQRSKYERHPRSAVGWSPTHVYFVTVDGRQPGLSVGMKLAELAEFMANLGCTDAMNLDGGKSAQLWFKGQIVNSPAQGEDTVANSLLVVRQAEAR